MAEVVDKHLTHAVDQLLQTQGGYVPLELLLAEGRLFYPDYQSWRGGEAEYLESLLFGDPEEVARLLEQAARYVAAQGLVIERRSYRNWRDDQGQPLRFSPDHIRDRLFHQCFVRSQEASQLDLFLDTSASYLVSLVCAALADRDPLAAREALGQLCESDAGNARLGPLERLTEALERLVGEEKGAGTPAECLGELEEEIAPLAEELLGSGCRDYLALFWESLFRRLRENPFDPRARRLHASYCALRLEDWPRLRESVEATPDWREQGELLSRHAFALVRLRDDAGFLRDWFRLCLRAPESVPELVARLGAEWRALWEAFLDAEPELEVEEYPGWLLIQRPVLAGWIGFARDEMEQLPDWLRTLVQLGRAADPVGSEAVALRRQLRDQHEGLFAHLLARR